jgi:hypothetical protein
VQERQQVVLLQHVHVGAEPFEQRHELLDALAVLLEILPLWIRPHLVGRQLDEQVRELAAAILRRQVGQR